MWARTGKIARNTPWRSFFRSPYTPRVVHDDATLSIFIYNSFFSTAVAVEKFPDVIRVQKLNSLFIVRLMVLYTVVQLCRQSTRVRPTHRHTRASYSCTVLFSRPPLTWSFMKISFEYITYCACEL